MFLWRLETFQSDSSGFYLLCFPFHMIRLSTVPSSPRRKNFKNYFDNTTQSSHIFQGSLSLKSSNSAKFGAVLTRRIKSDHKVASLWVPQNFVFDALLLQIFVVLSRYSFYGLKSLRDSVVRVSHSRINISLQQQIDLNCVRNCLNSRKAI